MIIYPAIDLRGGSVVRLREGNPDRQTVFSDSPVSVAQQWLSQGAEWLHVVNLDGAFAAANNNGTILHQITALGVPVQFGGGLRSKLDIETAIAAGAARVVLGTIAVQQPELVDWAVMRLGSDAVCVALDARAGFVTTHGWQETTAVTAAELGKQMAARGVRHCLYTDVGRDGGLAGVNLEATIALAQDTKLSIIASGGVSSVDDVYSLAVSGLVAGAVIGMALYENRLSLVEAIAAARAGAQDAG